MATKNPVGRPPKIKTAAEFDEKVEAYVESCKPTKDNEHGEPLTITGLALALGFCDKISLYEYQAKPEFTNSVKRARMLVENSYEKRISGNNATGPIFALKNFGWSDKQEVAHTSPDGSMSPPTRIEIVAPSNDSKAD